MSPLNPTTTTLTPTPEEPMKTTTPTTAPISTLRANDLATLNSLAISIRAFAIPMVRGDSSTLRRMGSLLTGLGDAIAREPRDGMFGHQIAYLAGHTAGLALLAGYPTYPALHPNSFACPECHKLGECFEHASIRSASILTPEAAKVLLQKGIQEHNATLARASSCTCGMRDMDGGAFPGPCPTHSVMGECHECGDPAPIGTYSCTFCTARASD